MSPTVSIVLPAYRQAQFLREAIDSCLRQTYPHFEAIVVDDASPDDTKTIVESYEDPRVRYVAHETNKGLALHGIATDR